MRVRYLLLGVFGVVVGAAGAFSDEWYGPPPVLLEVGSLRPAAAPLDVGSLKAAKKMPKSAVGGSKAVEGFVATYGTFRLGSGKFEGNVITPAGKPGVGIFRQFPLVYINEYTDPATGVEGSLYYTSLDDRAQRFYLFGKGSVASDAPLEQRLIIAYDGKGTPLHQARASYARASSEKEREKEEKGKGKKKKRDDDDD
jgi:hypothetical protein